MKSVKFKLPDGQSIAIKGADAVQLGETLLSPELLDPDYVGPSVFEAAALSTLAHQEPTLRKVRLRRPRHGRLLRSAFHRFSGLQCFFPLCNNCD